MPGELVIGRKMRFQISVAMVIATPCAIGYHADSPHPRFGMNWCLIKSHFEASFGMSAFLARCHAI